MEVEKLPKRHEPIPPSLDTISYLPDALLIEILSYLPTEIAVRTCVLSKRWKSLWTSIPILDFDAKRCPFENPYFVDFVDKVLTLRDGSDLLKFRLLYVHDDDYDDDGNTVPVDGSPVYKWIRSAMGYNVRELDLDLSIEREFELPRCVFTSGSLAALKLRLKCHALKFPTGVGFGCLKSLDLLRIKQMGDTQELDLFSNCPELEYLRISNCKKLGPVLNIFALKLKTLIIEDYWSVIKKIKVSAPNLLSFRYKGMLPNEFDMKDLSSLTHVFLEIRGRRIEIAECNIETAGLRTTKLIQGFFKAESLTLSELCIRVRTSVILEQKWFTFIYEGYGSTSAAQRNEDGFHLPPLSAL